MSWASGMTGVRGVAALFLESIWSSILPISFLRSLAWGSTVSHTLGYHSFVSPSPAAHRFSWPGNEG